MMIMKEPALPPLFGDDHLGLVPVEPEPERAVAEEHLRFGGHESGGERVQRAALVRLTVSLRVRVTGASVALPRRTGQNPVVRPVRNDGVMRHEVTRVGDGEGRQCVSVLRRVGEHGGVRRRGGDGDGARAARLRHVSLLRVAPRHSALRIGAGGVGVALGLAPHAFLSGEFC